MNKLIKFLCTLSFGAIQTILRCDMMRIKDAINKILWKYRNALENYYLVVVDRLNVSGFKRIPFKSIHSVDNYYVYVTNGFDTVVIPIHRVIMIEDIKGTVIWSREEGFKVDDF